MTYVIAEPCVDLKDKGCIDECPVDCIYEGDRMLYIQPDECVDCGACEPVCPVEAIFYEDDVPEQWSTTTRPTWSSSTRSALPEGPRSPARSPVITRSLPRCRRRCTNEPLQYRCGPAPGARESPGAGIGQSRAHRGLLQGHFQHPPCGGGAGDGDR